LTFIPYKSKTSISNHLNPAPEESFQVQGSEVQVNYIIFLFFLYLAPDYFVPNICWNGEYYL